MFQDRRVPHWLCHAVVVAVILVLVSIGSVADTSAAPTGFTPGTVVVGGDVTTVRVYPDGLRSAGDLSTGQDPALIQGLCFDSSGDLYVTKYFSRDNHTGVWKLDPSGQLVAQPDNKPADSTWSFLTRDSFISSDYGFFGPCVVDRANNIYVGGALPQSVAGIYKYSKAGALLTTYAVNGVRVAGGLDLSSDGCTMYYTSLDAQDTVRRFDVCSGTQLDDFATGLARGRGTQWACGVQARSNGEVLVACGPEVLRLDSAGNVMQRYPASSISLRRPAYYPYDYEPLNVLKLDPDGTSFWTGMRTIYMSRPGEYAYKVDIDSGQVLRVLEAAPGIQDSPRLSDIAVLGQ